jgi:kinesin family protein 18/19
MKYEIENKNMLDVYHRSREQKYAFDHVFTDHPIDFVYAKTSKRLIEPLFQGFNGCVFAYGATGTGKTHTMLGNDQIPGLINLSLAEIFKRKSILEKDLEISVKVSYVEIYNENIRDLLKEREKGDYLCLRDDPIKGVILAKATLFEVNEVNEVMNLLHKGNKKRTTEATNANETSSRSHAVFQIYLSMGDRNKKIKMSKKVSKLSLIDLAGSERGTQTENRGLRLREGAKINQSLLALANCINALGDKNRKGSFVPYRDSKLTRMLKDSLGGNCKTVMIVTISPASSQFEETLNTLKYANRAKEIKTKPIENKKLVEFHISEYKNIINDLRNEIENLRNKIKNSDNLESDICSKCEKQKEMEEEEVKKIQEELLENFQDRIQLRRALCELKAQNQLNELEIKQGKEKLLRYTISSGQLVQKENIEDLLMTINLPSSIKKEYEDIKKLKVSIDLNDAKKKLMKKELKEKSLISKNIMDNIPNRIKHREKREYLELMVKNHIFQLENDELEYNLKLQEKLNILLVEEIKRLREGLELGEEDQIDIDEKEDQNHAFFEINQRNEEIFSNNPFKKKKEVLTESHSREDNREEHTKKEKIISKDLKKKNILPPISNYTPKKDLKKRQRSKQQISKKKIQLDKIDQQVKDAVSVVNSLQNLRENSEKKKKVIRFDSLKRNIKN